MMDDVRPKVDFAVPNGRITLSDFAGEGAPQGLTHNINTDGLRQKAYAALHLFTRLPGYSFRKLRMIFSPTGVSMDSG